MNYVNINGFLVIVNMDNTNMDDTISSINDNLNYNLTGTQIPVSYTTTIAQLALAFCFEVLESTAQ